MCASLAASSFAQETWHLVLTQGVLYGICGSIGYLPCILYMEQWFVRRKGLAYGIMWSGTGLGGFIIPLLLEAFLQKWGFRTTLRIWATALFAIMLPATYYIKPRLPLSAMTRTKSYNLKFLLTKTFLLYQSANIIEGIGYFLPAVYLPTYARSVLSAGHFASALTVILINVASVFGVVIVGTLSDRLHPTTCILISTAGAVLGTFLLWGLAANLAVLYTFCIVYGFFAGSYISVWPAIMRHVADDFSAKENWNSAASSGKSVFEPILIWGFLVAGRGIGNIASGPLSEALIKGTPWRGQAAGGYGSGYGVLIAFTGVTAVIGGASFLWRRVGWM
ncbi:hypothetical protein NM208_g6102 [Fusarium decemcellulare]|uniref:Uncharacterized protein n=1 Tax=Fusarium decemcellulare TaxID=57161 RepID=A0ACC1SES3_9HYPO|nr:hypothetical protein NM208_g6102 [Fusarium decemcellulare]